MILAVVREILQSLFCETYVSQNLIVMFLFMQGQFLKTQKFLEKIF